jgi:hypothetical protein
VIFYFHENNSSSFSTHKPLIHKREINSIEKKIRINRETYTIPEQCQKCPGENGGGVVLTVIKKIKTFFHLI